MRFKHQGFVLLEVQVSIVVISIAVFTLIKMQTFIEQRGDLATQEVEAFHLIENKLELWKASADTRQIRSGEDLSFPPFHLIWRVDEPLLSVQEVVISAQWLDCTGQTHHVSAQTMLSMHFDEEADLTSDFDYH